MRKNNYDLKRNNNLNFFLTNKNAGFMHDSSKALTSAGSGPLTVCCKMWDLQWLLLADIY